MNAAASVPGMIDGARLLAVVVLVIVPRDALMKDIQEARSSTLLISAVAVVLGHLVRILLDHLKTLVERRRAKAEAEAEVAEAPVDVAVNPEAEAAAQPGQTAADAEAAVAAQAAKAPKAAAEPDQAERV